jgi:hypothetical protein
LDRGEGFGLLGDLPGSDCSRILAYDPHRDGYAVGFMDGREFSRDLGEQSYRVEDRPRVEVAPSEILGVAHAPLSAAG